MLATFWPLQFGIPYAHHFCCYAFLSSEIAGRDGYTEGFAEQWSKCKLRELNTNVAFSAIYGVIAVVQLF